MKTISVTNSPHADLAPGMKGEIVGENNGTFTVLFLGLRNSARAGLPFDTRVCMEASEFEIVEDPADNLHATCP